VGTRTPSPTAPLLTERKIVCAEVDDAAATRAREVESFMLLAISGFEIEVYNDVSVSTSSQHLINTSPSPLEPKP
jgi:hypothetical protein